MHISRLSIFVWWMHCGLNVYGWWLEVCVTQLKAPMLRCFRSTESKKPEESHSKSFERKKMWRLKEQKTTWDMKRNPLTTYLCSTDWSWHDTVAFCWWITTCILCFPSARHRIHYQGKKVYSYLSFTLMAAPLTVLTEIVVHYVLVHCPFDINISKVAV